MLRKLKTWHSGLSKVGKVVLWSITAVLAGTAINAAASPGIKTVSPATNPPAHSEPKTIQPVITKSTVTETAQIAFSKTTFENASLAKGTTKITTAGVNGVKTSIYELTFTDGKQTDKTLVKEEVTTPPITEVTARGTYVAPVATPPPVTAAPKSDCDPNYSGACVPNVYPSDVDCAGGSGNGPYYVQGPVNVIGSDRYALDGNHDGVACQ